MGARFLTMALAAGAGAAKGMAIVRETKRGRRVARNFIFEILLWV